MKTRRKLLRMLLPVALTVGSAAACSSTTTPEPAAQQPSAGAKENSAKQELAPVKLTWLLRMGAQSDLPAVQEAVNKITKQKINAEVELRFIEPGTFDSKLKTMIAAGENFDITFVSSSIGGDFYGSVAKGAFMPIDELLPKYAPQTVKSIPKGFWKAVTVDSRIYGVPNYQIVARQNGLTVLKSAAEKYGLKLEQIRKLEEIEPFLEKIKQSESGAAIPLGLTKSGIWKDMLTYYGYDSIVSPTSPGTVRIDDGALKVINQFEETAFKEHVSLMRSWFLKGYINKDAAVVADTSNMSKSGNMFTSWGDIKPGGEAETKKLFGDKDILKHSLEEPFVTTSNISATLQAISRTSKNPERAMMLIEMVNTDKELYNLLVYGIEGKHYKKIADNRIEPVENSAYFPNRGWAFGNQFNAYLVPGQPDGVWEATIALNEKATQSKLMGFVFNMEPVKTEIAQAQAVVDEFLPALWTGSVDPDKYLPQFLEKLKTAGGDKIIAEKQKQVEAWKNQQGK